METIFYLSNILVLPFWIMMAVLPHWQGTKRIISSLWIVVPFLLLYTLLVLPNMATLAGDLANAQLSTIAALLGTPEGATIAWVHFVALDLFAGRWIYLDSRQHNFTAWLVSPLLLLTMLFAPFGLLLYLAVRARLLRRTA